MSSNKITECSYIFNPIPPLKPISCRTIHFIKNTLKKKGRSAYAKYLKFVLSQMKRVLIETIYKKNPQIKVQKI